MRDTKFSVVRHALLGARLGELQDTALDRAMEALDSLEAKMTSLEGLVARHMQIPGPNVHSVAPFAIGRECLHNVDAPMPPGTIISSGNPLPPLRAGL